MQTQETVIHLKVPPLPESVSDATILTWHKKPGETAKRDETLVDLETDKVVIEVPAPADGILQEILQSPGAKVNTDQLLGIFQTSVIATSAIDNPIKPEITPTPTPTQTQKPLSPSTRRLLGEHDIHPATITGTGKAGRITPEDIKLTLKKADSTDTQDNKNYSNNTQRPEQRITMSRLRKRIAERLLSVQQNAAILTTFNEVNLQSITDLRQRYKDQFEKTHQVRLGFMSFFTQAVVKALQRFPAVNASIDGEDIIYHGYYDIGVAVSTERGLVVPVLRDADKMSLADIEKNIATYGKRARDNQLTLAEITGGTFTITNGGVFGSLLSTPILNPPQSAILGMHKIQERPMAENGQIVIRPMMYLALSYDHRIIDGKESVKFLATIKELLEDPSRILLEI